jgi:hypothetical protein
MFHHLRLPLLAIAALISLSSCVSPPPVRPDKAVLSGAGSVQLVVSRPAELAKGHFLAPPSLFNPTVVAEPGRQVLMLTLRQTLPAGLGEVITNTHFADATATLQAGHTYSVKPTIVIDKSKSIWTHSIPSRQTVTYSLIDNATQQVLATATGKDLHGKELMMYLVSKKELLPLMKANMPASGGE